VKRAKDTSHIAQTRATNVPEVMGMDGGLRSICTSAEGQTGTKRRGHKHHRKKFRSRSSGSTIIHISAREAA
jgi:hypothetical protein